MRTQKYITCLTKQVETHSLPLPAHHLDLTLHDKCGSKTDKKEIREREKRGGKTRVTIIIAPGYSIEKDM